MVFAGRVRSSPTNEKPKCNKYQKFVTFPAFRLRLESSKKRLDWKMPARNRNQFQEIMTNDSECEATFDPVSRKGGYVCVCVVFVVGGFLACKSVANCCKYRSKEVLLTAVTVFFFSFFMKTRTNQHTNQQIKVTGAG